MEDNSDDEQESLTRCWVDCLAKQYYDAYLKVKDLPDDTNITFELKNPKGEFFYTPTISVGRLKCMGELIKEIENRKKQSKQT